MRTDAVHQVLETEIDDAGRRHGERPVRVLDVGGGSGVWAVPLASAGCHVTVVDPSPDALATLARRAADAGVADRVTPLQGDTEALAALTPDGGADLVLAHDVLEYVDDVPSAASALAEATAPGGAVSVLVANRYAAVLAWAVAGKVTEALDVLRAPEGNLGDVDPLQRRFDTEALDRVLAAVGLTVERVQGLGVLTDLVPGSVLDSNPRAAEAMATLESVAADQPPLRDIATRLHAIARKPV